MSSKLEKQIEEHAASVKTDSYSMSVGELASMYRDGELDLHPEFQRFFRWSVEQKSRFIESMLLDIPVPAVFVSERANSKWEVIDGLQRLSTLFEFMGELKDENGKIKPALELSRAHYLDDLEGRQWNSETKGVPESVKIRIKRARLDVNIIKNVSDDDVKYEVFQRLNTGGSIATDQEVRNCALIMTNDKHFKWLQALSRNAHFKASLAISERSEYEAFDMELVTRFVVFVVSEVEDLKRIDELGAYLTMQSRKQAKDKDFPRKKIEVVFNQTFEFLANNLGEDAFKRYDTAKGRYFGPTLASLFEVLAIGLGHKLLAGGGLPKADEFIKLHKRIWKELGVKSFVGSGVRASTRIPGTIKYGRDLFAGA